MPIFFHPFFYQQKIFCPLLNLKRLEICLKNILRIKV
jgi:hypothetical protein